MFKNSLKIAVIVAVVMTSVAAQQPTVKRTVLKQEDLVNNPGYAVALVRVDLPVGAREGRHQHPGTLVALVEEGTLTLDYEGKPTMQYKVGDTFYVEPGKIHEGMNKGTVPVKLIASFVFPKDKAITIQVP